MLKDQKYYKFLSKTFCSKFQWFSYERYLPNEYAAGKWLPSVYSVALCRSGYHAAHADWLHEWADVLMYEVELDGTIVSDSHKVAGQSMRLLRLVDTWNEKTVRKFLYWLACECTNARHVGSEYKGLEDALNCIESKILDPYTKHSAYSPTFDALVENADDSYRRVMWECIDNKPFYLAVTQAVNAANPLLGRSLANRKLAEMLEI